MKMHAVCIKQTFICERAPSPILSALYFKTPKSTTAVQCLLNMKL